MANTGNITVTERDMNPLSPTYDTTRTRTYQDYTRCVPDGTKLFWTDTNDVSHSYACDGHSIVRITDYSRTTGLLQLKTVSVGNCATSIGSSAYSTVSDYVFANATSLESLVMADSVHLIGRAAVMGCFALTTLVLSNGLDTIGIDAFKGDRSLETLNLPSSLETIYDSAFFGCTGLTSITILATTPPTLNGDNHFANTNNCPIYVPAASVSAYQSASGWSNYASRIQAIPT